MTVRESIIKVLSQNLNDRFSANEITKSIIENKIYNFENAKYPTKVVGSELNKMIKKNEYSLYVDKERRPFIYFIKN